MINKDPFRKDEPYPKTMSRGGGSFATQCDRQQCNYQDDTLIPWNDTDTVTSSTNHLLRCCDDIISGKKDRPTYFNYDTYPRMNQLIRDFPMEQELPSYSSDIELVPFPKQKKKRHKKRNPHYDHRKGRIHVAKSKPRSPEYMTTDDDDDDESLSDESIDTSYNRYLKHSSKSSSRFKDDARRQGTKERRLLKELELEKLRDMKLYSDRLPKNKYNEKSVKKEKNVKNEKSVKKDKNVKKEKNVRKEKNVKKEKNIKMTNLANRMKKVSSSVASYTDWTDTTDLEDNLDDDLDNNLNKPFSEREHFGDQLNLCSLSTLPPLNQHYTNSQPLNLIAKGIPQSSEKKKKSKKKNTKPKERKYY